MTNNRVILIKGGNSKWYEQAIFIVRKDAPKSQIPVDFVFEAERIINNYMRGESSAVKAPARPQKRRVKNTAFDYVLNTLIIACCIALVCIMLYAVFT